MGGRALLLAGALVLAGCGSGGPGDAEEPPDRGAEEAATTLVRSLGSAEADAVCEHLTARSRRAIERLARARGERGCSRGSLSGLRPLYADEPEATGTRAGGEATLVEISGVPEPLRVVQEGDAWRVDALGYREARERIAFETVCSSFERRLNAMPLPPTDTAGYARYVERVRRMLAAARKRLDRIDFGPGPVRTALPKLVRSLRRVERGLATVVRSVRGGSSVFDAARKGRKSLAAAAKGTRAGTFLDTMSCGVDPLELPATRKRFRPPALKACRAAARRVKRAGTPDTPGEFEAAAGIYDDLERALRRAPAPKPLRSLVRSTAGAIGDIGDEIRAAVSAARAGDLATLDAAEERIGAVTVRAGSGIVRLELGPCRSI